MEGTTMMKVMIGDQSFDAALESSGEIQGSEQADHSRDFIQQSSHMSIPS